MTFVGPRHNRASLPEFYPTLRTRVSAYFQEHNLSRHANAHMVVKTVVLVCSYFGPLAVMYTGMVSNIWLILGMWSLMGLGMAGIGMSIMHDANHGAYSRNPTVNRILGYLLYFVGGNADFWKVQHNVLHHTYPNVHGADEDIDVPILLRFSPQQKRYWIHRFQHVYAFVLYGFLTIPWITSKEVFQLLDYKKRGLLPEGKAFRNLLMRAIVFKVVYYIVLLILPLVLLPISPWITLLGFLVMHYIASFLLGLIFQTAHVMPGSEYPKTDSSGNLESSWAVHQLITTTNYAPKSRVLSWFVGGLNFQIEHHLFPNICHVHYKRISNIVKETAQEYGLPYNSEKNFLDAVIAHGKVLYALGHQQELNPVTNKLS